MPTMEVPVGAVHDVAAAIGSRIADKLQELKRQTEATNNAPVVTELRERLARTELYLALTTREYLLLKSEDQILRARLEATEAKLKAVIAPAVSAGEEQARD